MSTKFSSCLSNSLFRCSKSIFSLAKAISASLTAFSRSTMAASVFLLSAACCKSFHNLSSSALGPDLTASLMLLEVAHDWLPLVFVGNALLQNGDMRAGDDLSELEQTRELIWIAPERGFLLPRIQANILSMLVGIRRTWRYTFSCHCVR